VDSFCILVTNPDSKKVRFVPYETNPDLFRIVDHKSLMFSKILFVDSFRRLIFQRFDLFSQIQRILTNPYESLRILSTIARNESLRIQAGGLVNLDLRIRTLKIRIADLICRALFKRFVSWICFVGLFSKDLFRGFIL
jgi:hypothetical protein